MSVSSHTRLLEASVPTNMKTSAMTEYTGAAFCPNRYITFIFPKRFQPSMVENAKKKRQTATKYRAEALPEDAAEGGSGPDSSC